VIPAQAMFRKVASVLLVVSLWLSLLQGGLSAHETARDYTDTLTPARLSHLLAEPKPAIVDRAPTAKVTASHEGSGDPLIVPGLDAAAVIWSSATLRNLPPSRAPPRSSASHHFQARAPPVA